MHIHEGTVHLKSNNSKDAAGQQIYYTVLKARGSDLMFMDEIEKKHFLDILLGIRIRFKMEVFAYCVLDGEAHILAGESQNEMQEQVWESLKKEFARYHEKMHGKNLLDIYYEISDAGVMEDTQILAACIKMHMLPVVYKRVQQAEDYWWSSLKEYQLRYRSGIVLAGELLSCLDENHRIAARMFRKLQNNVSTYINV